MEKKMKHITAAALIVAANVALCAEEKPLNVLMIGNSFCRSCLQYLPAVSASVPGCRLNLEMVCRGGCSLETHIRMYERTEKEPAYRGCTDSKKRPVNLQELLTRCKWDIITIQQASHYSWRPESYQPWADKLIQIIRKTNPQAEIVIQQTWSYNAGDLRIHDKNGPWGIDQTEMFNRLDAAYRKLAKEYKLRIIPMGLAVQLTREDKPRQLPAMSKEDMAKHFVYPALPPNDDVVGNVRWSKDKKQLSCDTIHLNRAGEYLQACVWFGFLFQKKVSEIRYVPPVLKKDPAMVKKIRDCAQRALDQAK